MTSQPQRGTTIEEHSTGLRVRFSCPDEGYSLDDLDALSIAIAHAKRSLTSQPPTPMVAFETQQARMAAPS